MNIDEIETKYGDFLYVWVRPSEGRTWREFHRSTLGQHGDRDWRPALVSGFPDPEDRRYYNTGMDPRSVMLIGNAYSHKPHEFEYGGMLTPPDAVVPDTPTPSPIQNSMTNWV